MNATRSTSTPTLVSALRILAGEIQSYDGVANAAIAEGADRIESLAAELASVTAERDAEFRRSDSELAAAALKESELRARVAELDSETMVLRGAVEAVTAQRQQAEQRNAELVAALDAALNSDQGSRAMMDARKTLARAESGTPAKHPDETCAQCGKVKRLVGLPRCECDECNQEAAR